MRTTVRVLSMLAALLLGWPVLASAFAQAPARAATSTATRVATGARATAGATGGWVAARALPRGHVLTAADVSSPSPTPHPRTPIIGWSTRRVVAEGEALREPAIAPPTAVAAGEKIAVVWRDAGIELRLAGVAAHAAPLGARVAVRVDARRRLEGTVVAPGLVRLP